MRQLIIVRRFLSCSANVMASSRAFPNPFQDHSGEQLIAENGKTTDYSRSPENFKQQLRLDAAFSKRIEGCVKTLMPQLYSGLQHAKKNDYSVYTGQTGIALLHLHLYDTFPHAPDRQSYLETAIGYLQPALRHLGSGVYTFLCGDAGVLAVAAVAFSRLGDARTCQECVNRLTGLHSDVVRQSDIPDEHLYGRAGYLAAVLFVQSHLGSNDVFTDVIRKVVCAMLASGQALSHRKGSKSPLMYSWYREYYLGAAHGLAGIVYTLLLMRKDPELCGDLDRLLPGTLDYLLTLRFPSGNFPAVLGDSDDRLVHWCHGAPGWASMWCLAYQAYNKSQYLEAAERCGEVTWSRGLLKKGYSLCHGPAGNAYAFLALFRLTKDQKHLYRACKFAEWCFDYGKHGCRTPDTPFSMFEGMAGTIYFLVDLLDPMKARFPAYEF